MEREWGVNKKSQFTLYFWKPFGNTIVCCWVFLISDRPVVRIRRDWVDEVERSSWTYFSRRPKSMFSPPVALPHSYGGPRFPTYPETLISFFPQNLLCFILGYLVILNIFKLQSVIQIGLKWSKRMFSWWIENGNNLSRIKIGRSNLPVDFNEIAPLIAQATSSWIQDISTFQVIWNP